MPEADSSPHGGWSIGPSIALELDAALSFALHPPAGKGNGSALAALSERIAPDWHRQWKDLFGENRAFTTYLEPAAQLANVLSSADYSAVTLVLRQLSLETALAEMEAMGVPFELTADAGLPPAARLVELAARLQGTLYRQIGFPEAQCRTMAQQRRAEMERTVRILPGGDWHARFWLLMDRFYYEFYRPWRAAHTAEVIALEQKALTVLGSAAATGQPPNLAWLPAQNPILRYPELQAAVQDGRLHVFFWLEPFGMADLFSLWPGRLMVSIAEPGEVYQDFIVFTEDVARRVQALADPTRLLILRLIRHFGMINTELAAYLGMARPTISIHAKILRQAGLIRSTQQGRVVRHEVVPGEVRRLFKDLEELLDLPDEPPATED